MPPNRLIDTVKTMRKKKNFIATLTATKTLEKDQTPPQNSSVREFVCFSIGIKGHWPSSGKIGSLQQQKKLKALSSAEELH